MGSGAASAGEVTGTGQPTPPGSRSVDLRLLWTKRHAECPEEGGRVQSYGQIVSQGFKEFVPSPGEACNGHSGFLAGGGGE